MARGYINISIDIQMKERKQKNKINKLYKIKKCPNKNIKYRDSKIKIHSITKKGEISISKSKNELLKNNDSIKHQTRYEKVIIF